MKILETIEQVRFYRKEVSLSSRTLALVPTMGGLHEGHLSLVHLAKESCDEVVVSIFVNPTQFNDPTDYENYKIDLNIDIDKLKQVGASAVFIPSVDEIYAKGFQASVEIEQLTKDHEGEFRPGHFKGVTTVVSILFNIVQPDSAVFGEKDFQQLRIVEQLVKDLCMPISIVRGPLVRAHDGLALSSRNARLSGEQRAIALEISKALLLARSAFEKGERGAQTLTSIVNDHLSSFSLIRPEYVNLVDEESLMIVEGEVFNPVRVLVAAWVGGVRLLDNMQLRTS